MTKEVPQPDQTRNHYGSGFDISQVIEQIKNESAGNLEYYRRLGPSLRDSEAEQDDSAA